MANLILPLFNPKCFIHIISTSLIIATLSCVYCDCCWYVLVVKRRVRVPQMFVHDFLFFIFSSSPRGRLYLRLPHFSSTPHADVFSVIRFFFFFIYFDFTYLFRLCFVGLFGCWLPHLTSSTIHNIKRHDRRKNKNERDIDIETMNNNKITKE